TPNANFNGADTISYTVVDGRGGSASASVAVTVTAGNDAPVAANDTAIVSEDGRIMLAVLANDRDADGDRLTVTTATATNGIVVVNPDGTLTYSPATNFNGTDVIRYTVSDGRGGTSTASVMVSVDAVNDAPIAIDDVATTRQDTFVRISVLANDRDVDGDALTLGTASAANGTVVINADGTLTYTPRAGFSGPDTITYNVLDARGGNAGASVAVGVAARLNGAPVDAGETVAAVAGQPVTVDVLANASDPDGDRLSIASATADRGSVTINADGTLTYLADPTFDGIAVVTYVVVDAAGERTTSTLTVVVGAAPTADVSQLLAIGRPGMILPRADATSLTSPLVSFIATDPILLNSIKEIRSLGGLADLTDGVSAEGPILDAVNELMPLNGIGTSAINGSPVGDEVARIERRTDLRVGLSRLFDRRFDDFAVEGLTGFSVRTQGDGEIVIESVVRHRTIYVEVRDAEVGDDAPFVEFRLRMTDGRALPDWIRFDSRGLAIIETPPDAETIRLIVRAVRADNSYVDTGVVIQGATGEIQLDPAAMGRTQSSAPSLDALALAEATMAAREAARLTAAFG
ncbi:cadherin-like domain-containing protein, partial [Sphingomonas prati]